MRDSRLALPDERDNAFVGVQAGGTPRRSAWRRIVCAARGHALEPAVPEAPLLCRYCGTTWTWEQLFSSHIPRSRRGTQRAYDDWRPEDATEIPVHYL